MHTYLVTERSGSYLIFASTALPKGLPVYLDVASDFLTAMTARLVEGSGLVSLVTVQSREELSLSGAAENVLNEGRRHALVALNLGHEVAKVLDMVLLDCGSILHHHGAEDDREVLGQFIKVKVVPRYFSNSSSPRPESSLCRMSWF